MVRGTELASTTAPSRSRVIGRDPSGANVSGATVTEAVPVRAPTVAVIVPSPGAVARKLPALLRVPPSPAIDQADGRAGEADAVHRGVHAPRLIRDRLADDDVTLARSDDDAVERPGRDRRDDE